MADTHLCQDCGQPCAEPLDICPSCSSWRERKLAQLEDDRLDKLARRKRFRPLGSMSGADFGETLADMAKAVERSRR
jgi:hypothetical protein